MTRILKLTSLLALALFAGAVTTNAQTITKMDAEIGFDFAIGNKTLDAGKYEVRVTRNAAGNSLVRVVNDSGNVVHTVFATQSGELAGDKSKLVFTRHQGRWALSTVSMRDSAIELRKPSKGRPSVEVKTE